MPTVPRTHRATLAVAGVLALGAAGCSSTAPAPAAAHSPSAGAALSGTVTVFAAASLTGAFQQLATEFERQHPGVRVKFDFGGSDTLAAGITSGAPADVFAAASAATMKTVTSAGDAAGPPADFARNQLEIAVPPGDPKGIRTLADLAAPGVELALCAPTVPCGAAAAKAAAAGGVTLKPVTLETDVKAALTKVELGEADAALVYRTDVGAAAGKVTGIPFPQAAQAVNTYPIAVLKDAPDPAAARAFVAFVRSPQGERILTAAGFQQP